MIRWVFFTATRIFSFFFLLICLIVVGDYGPPRFDVPTPTYKPGQTVHLGSVFCYWSEWKYSQTLPCTTYGPHENLEIIFQYQRVVSASISFTKAKDTVGDYIVAWGTPKWIKRNPYSTILAWGDRGLYLAGTRKFTPFMPVGGVWRRNSPYLFWSFETWDGFKRK